MKDSSPLRRLLLRVVPWLAGALFVHTVARGLRTPHHYAIGHWLHNYDHGLVPRGLPGALAQPLFSYKSGEDVRSIATVLVVLSFLLFAYLVLRGATTGVRAARERGLDGLALGAVLVFVGSPFIVFTSHVFGYFDQLIAAALLACILLLARDRYALAGLLSGAAVLVHEIYLLLALPLLVFTCALQYSAEPNVACTAPSPGRWWRRAAVLFAPPLAAAAALGLAGSGNTHPALAGLRQEMREYGAIPAPWVRLSTQHFTQGPGDLLRTQHEHGLDRLLDGAVLASSLPALLFMLAACALVLWRLRRMHWLPVYIVAVLTPLSLHWVAWDNSRFTHLTIFGAFAGLLAAFLAAPRLPAARPPPRWWTAAVALGVMSTLLADLRASVPLMGGQRDGAGMLSVRWAPRPQAYECDRLLFANSDFEHGTLDGWSTVGAAFVHQPLSADPRLYRRLPGKQGEHWVGSFDQTDPTDARRPLTQGDAPRGRLVSRHFLLDGERVTFLVGGGADRRHSYVALEVDGAELRRTSGRRSERMRTVTWEVGAYRGKRARVLIVDESSGDWGHVNADGFCYDD